MYNKKNLNVLLVLIATLAITSCGGKTDSSSVTDNSNTSDTFKESSDTSINTDEVSNEDLDWSLNYNNYLNSKSVIAITDSKAQNRNLTISVDDGVKEEKLDTKASVTFNYENTNINSDNSNNAADYIYLNGKKLQKLPSDGHKGVTISEDLLQNGRNTIGLTIGGYWGQPEYDENKNHGNQGCDDYTIQDFHLTLPTNQKLYPQYISKYYPLKVGIPASQNNMEIVDEEYDPTVSFWIGDGWGGPNDGCLTSHPNSNPRFDIPYKVEFTLWYEKPTITSFEVDTTKYTDGAHNIKIYEDDKLVLAKNSIFDNTAPEIKLNILDYSMINIKSEQIESEITDSLSGILDSYVKLDGTEVTKETTLNELTLGKHTIMAYAIDKASNITYKEVEFTALENGTIKDVKVTDNKIETKSKVNMTTYDAKNVTYSLLYGTTKECNSLVKNLPYTNTLESDMPCVSVEFKTTAKDILVNFEGGTLPYERYKITAKNTKTNTIDTLKVGYGTENVIFALDTTNYLSNGKIALYIQPDYVSNNTDTMLWVTDTQHYTKFDDLNKVLTQVYQYCADQYSQNIAGYMIHTGDLVDDNPKYPDAARKEWNIASKAQEIIEKVGMPNGVVTGNHDTCTALQELNYSYFWEFFGQDRFNDLPWYGGSLNNNASHYDLITIDDQDFMILYLGYGVEGDPDTIAWANSVISHFPNRNVILATHDYLEYNGGNGRPDANSRYDVIFNEIIVPNDNVKMILCGHDNGAYHRKVNIPNSTRYIYEILSDYQFVDEEPSKHKIGDVAGCSGDGYLRIMKFNGNIVSSTTYSPYRNKKNYFGAADEFDVEIDFNKANRQVIVNSLNVYELSNAKTTNDITSLTVDAESDCVVYLTDNNNNSSYQIITK